jgi:hypothetical protein
LCRSLWRLHRWLSRSRGSVLQCPPLRQGLLRSPVQQSGSFVDRRNSQFVMHRQDLFRDCVGASIRAVIPNHSGLRTGRQTSASALAHAGDDLEIARRFDRYVLQLLGVCIAVLIVLTGVAKWLCPPLPSTLLMRACGLLLSAGLLAGAVSLPIVYLNVNAPGWVRDGLGLTLLLGTASSVAVAQDWRRKEHAAR